MAKLFVVGTPIGNLKDITFRAVETLSAVDVIFCEDTRHSQILLNHYEIAKPTFSAHKFNEKEASKKLVTFLEKGKDVAYISDAGMPLVSDPGFLLVQQAKNAGFEVEIVPGVTACCTALVGSLLSASHFCFLGFLPEQNLQRTKLLQQYKNIDATLIFYVSSHSVDKDLQTLFENLGKRKVVVANELTKKFEKYIDGELGTVAITQPKGEYVVLVEGVVASSPLNDLSLEEHLNYYLEQGLKKMDAIKKVAEDLKIAKSEIYKQLL